jgi:hypothetical protein
MSDKPTWILIAAAVVAGGAIVAVIAYYIARFLRGSITLSLPRTVFNPGDTITGSFDLLTKKPIEGNKLSVSLIGIKVTKTHRGGGHEGATRRTHSEEIYRDELLVEEARSYQAGHTSQYEFELAVPNTSEPKFMSSALGQTLTAALGFLSNKSTRLKWNVEAQLDAKGVDLVATKAVTINMKRLV